MWIFLDFLLTLWFNVNEVEHMRRLKRRSRLGRAVRTLSGFSLLRQWQDTFSVWSSDATAPGAPGNPKQRTGNLGDGPDGDDPYGTGRGGPRQRQQAQG